MSGEIAAEALAQRAAGGPIMLVVEIYPDVEGVQLARCLWRNVDKIAEVKLPLTELRKCNVTRDPLKRR
jgi:hypothetical protein